MRAGGAGGFGVVNPQMGEPPSIPYRPDPVIPPRPDYADDMRCLVWLCVGAVLVLVLGMFAAAYIGATGPLHEGLWAAFTLFAIEMGLFTLAVLKSQAIGYTKHRQKIWDATHGASETREVPL